MTMFILALDTLLCHRMFLNENTAILGPDYDAYIKGTLSVRSPVKHHLQNNCMFQQKQKIKVILISPLISRR
jgi:hypothetical protein